MIEVYSVQDFLRCLLHNITMEVEECDASKVAMKN